MPFDYLWYKFSELIFNGCFTSTVHDQLAGELVKARLMKASGRFDEALEVINNTVARLPDYPEALLLKAQILWEGYNDSLAATACLEKILAMKRTKNEQDETIRRWSENMLKEIRHTGKRDSSRAKKDK